MLEQIPEGHMDSSCQSARQQHFEETVTISLKNGNS